MKKCLALVSICCMALLVSFNANANPINKSYSSTDILHQALPKYSEILDLSTLSNTMPAYLKKVVYEIASGKMTGKMTAVKLKDGTILYSVSQGCADYYTSNANDDWMVKNICESHASICPSRSNKYQFVSIMNDGKTFTTNCLSYNQKQDTGFYAPYYTPASTMQNPC